MSPLITKWITFTPAVDLNPPVGATLYADIYTMKISGSVKVTPFNSRPGGVYYVRGPISDGVKQLTGYLDANNHQKPGATPDLVITWSAPQYIGVGLPLKIESLEQFFENERYEYKDLILEGTNYPNPILPPDPGH